MKKKYILLIGFIILLLVIFVYIVHSTLKDKESKKDYITYITINELKEKIKNKNNFVLVFTQEGCSHCSTYHEVINNVAKEYDIKIYDINLTDVKNEDVADLNKIATISGTPTTLFYINGEEQTTLNRINGSISKTNLVNKLKKMGYIKE